jgi:hypothetical protein
MPVQTRSSAKYDKETTTAAHILMEMKSGSLTRIHETCALDGGACCYMEDKRPFISDGFKEIHGYEDGVGCYTRLAPYWIHYCPPCQTFWKIGSLRRSARIANQIRK